jgi:hypothetical protein
MFLRRSHLQFVFFLKSFDLFLHALNMKFHLLLAFDVAAALSLQLRQGYVVLSEGGGEALHHARLEVRFS